VCRYVGVDRVGERVWEKERERVQWDSFQERHSDYCCIYFYQITLCWNELGLLTKIISMMDWYIGLSLNFIAYVVP
jgi:hypothetical protein